MRDKTKEMITKIDWRVWAAFSIAIAFMTIGFLAYTNSVKEDLNHQISERSEKRARENNKIREDLRKTNEELNSLADSLTAQIRQFRLCQRDPKAKDCKKPVAPPPSAIVDQEGRENPTPSLASLLALARQARAEFCAVERCTGRDGLTPTEADLRRLIAPIVQQGIIDWCSTRNDCIGANGQDSTVPGPQGPEGPAGPSCREGYTPEEMTVVTQSGPETILACRAAPPSQEGE